MEEKIYQYLYDNIPEMCVSLDNDQIITHCNAVFSKSIGFKKKEILGKSIMAFFDTDDYENVKTFFTTLKPRVIVKLHKICTMHRDDPDREPMYVSLQAIRMDNKQASFDSIALINDVSQRINLEKQQKKARQQLYQSARLTTVGILSSGIAHELNNPLTAILGFSDSLLFRFKEGESIDSKEIVEYLTIIKTESLRCRDVIENLSKFSQDYESQTEKIPLHDCLHSAIQLMNLHAQKKSITIINTVGIDTVVQTDGHKIGQVIVNVLSNSIDFSAPGDTIIITIDKFEESSDVVKLHISDKGSGISEEILPKIFDPFFTTKKVGEGAGLGMSISYKLMEECHGTISVKSQKDQGTTVILEIPTGK